MIIIISNGIERGKERDATGKAKFMVVVEGGGGEVK